MSELEIAPVEKEESDKKKTVSFFKKFLDFVKKYMNTLIFVVVAFLIGYFLSQNKSCPKVLEGDFTSSADAGGD